jgi:hypothetical protein
MTILCLDYWKHLQGSMTEVHKGEEPAEPSIWDLSGRERHRQERRAQVTRARLGGGSLWRRRGRACWSGSASSRVT